MDIIRPLSGVETKGTKNNGHHPPVERSRNEGNENQWTIVMLKPGRGSC